MNGFAVNSLPQQAFMLPARRASQKGSLFAAMVLGLSFNASMASVMGSTLGMFSTSVGHAIAAGALVGLIVFGWFRTKRFTLSSLPLNLKASVVALCVTTFLLGAYGYMLGGGQQNIILFKTGGILVSFFALASSSRNFNYNEVRRGLLIFAIVELVGCILVFRVGSDVNENAIAVRATVACMCLFTLLRSKWLGWLAVIGCLSFSVMLDCRTSAVAFIGSIAFLQIEKHSRRQRGLVLFLSMTALICSLIVIPFLMSALEQLALASLGSDNPIAKFFLHDKTASKVSYDYLDRFDVWSYSWEFIREKPLLGYGLGTEKAIMRVRCHNGYLSLMFEGGAVFLLAWLWFYARSIASFFDRRWVATVGNSELFYLVTILLSYMLVAAIVESSGLASVSTPINLIFIFLSFWLFQPNRDRYNRSVIGG